MRHRLMTTGTLFALLVAVAGAQAQDVERILQDVAENIGANDLNTLHFSGTDGWAAFPGASYAPEVDWTRFALVGYSKAVDFDAGYLREQFTRTFGNYAQLGGSQGVPTEGEGVLDIVLNGDYTWLQEGAGGPYQREGLMDGIPHTELRKLDMLLIPHGFVKAALARGAHPTMVTTGPRGQQRRYVSVVAQGKYRITATINESDEIENLQTHVANPMFGDMLYENSFGPYQQFGTVSFPSVIRHFVGDPRLYPGHSMMEIEISSVSANEPVNILPVPATAMVPTQSPSLVESEEIGDGIWYLGGIRHGSVLVEFDDFVAVVEAPLNEKRALAVIDEVYTLAPDKPIRYLVNSHHHFDHSGGLRTFVAEGAKVVTHERNREFYERVILSPAPRTLEPDRLYLLNPPSYRESAIEPVATNGVYTISDGSRTLEVRPLPYMTHVATMVIAYLPNERMAVFADTNPQEVMRLGLDTEKYVSLHGGLVSPPE